VSISSPLDLFFIFLYFQEMIPSARLVVYHVAAGGHIAADSLSFPVIPAPGKEVRSFFVFT
jgi:hypothetical protein